MRYSGIGGRVAASPACHVEYGLYPLYESGAVELEAAQNAVDAGDRQHHLPIARSVTERRRRVALRPWFRHNRRRITTTRRPVAARVPGCVYSHRHQAVIDHLDLTATVKAKMTVRSKSSTLTIRLSKQRAALATI